MFKLWFKDLAINHTGTWNSETNFYMDVFDGLIDTEFSRRYSWQRIKVRYQEKKRKKTYICKGGKYY